MNCDVRFCSYCDRPKPPAPQPRWFRRRPTYTCECGYTYRAGRRGWDIVVQQSAPWRPGGGYTGRYEAPNRLEVPRGPAPGAVGAAGDGALESRVPVLNPWAGVAVLALHSHTADESCGESCSVYERHADVDTP